MTRCYRLPARYFVSRSDSSGHISYAGATADDGRGMLSRRGYSNPLSGGSRSGGVVQRGLNMLAQRVSSGLINALGGEYEEDCLYVQEQIVESTFPYEVPKILLKLFTAEKVEALRKPKRRTSRLAPGAIDYSTRLLTTRSLARFHFISLRKLEWMISLRREPISC